MNYSQSICAQNLMTSINKIDKLYKEGMKFIHLDFMDFHYTKSFGLSIETAKFIKERYSNAFVDAHLMVEKPYDVIEKLKFLDYFFIPVDKYDFNKNNKNIGVFLEAKHNIEDHIEIIEKSKMIMIMTIEKIGGTGQKMHEYLCERAQVIKNINPNINIFSDGGLRLENILVFKENGFDVAVGGSIINDFDNKNFIEFFEGGEHVHG